MPNLTMMIRDQAYEVEYKEYGPDPEVGIMGWWTDEHTVKNLDGTQADVLMVFLTEEEWEMITDRCDEAANEVDPDDY